MVFRPRNTRVNHPKLGTTDKQIIAMSVWSKVDSKTPKVPRRRTKPQPVTLLGRSPLLLSSDFDYSPVGWLGENPRTNQPTEVLNTDHLGFATVFWGNQTHGKKVLIQIWHLIFFTFKFDGWWLGDNQHVHHANIRVWVKTFYCHLFFDMLPIYYLGMNKGYRGVDPRPHGRIESVPLADPHAGTLSSEPCLKVSQDALANKKPLPLWCRQTGSRWCSFAPRFYNYITHRIHVCYIW